VAAKTRVLKGRGFKPRRKSSGINDGFSRWGSFRPPKESSATSSGAPQKPPVFRFSGCGWNSQMFETRQIRKRQETLAPHPADAHARSPTYSPVRAGLMRDEVRKKIRQHSEQRESGNAVSRENPSSAAFMVPGGRRRGRTGISRRNDWGPIFHAKASDGRIVAQVHYASRLPRFMARQDYLSGILPRIYAGQREKCDL